MPNWMKALNAELDMDIEMTLDEDDIATLVAREPTVGALLTIEVPFDDLLDVHGDVPHLPVLMIEHLN